MLTGGRVDGIDKVLSRLNTKLGQIKGGSRRGFMKAGLKVQRRSQQYVPVEYNNLRPSAYAKPAGRMSVVVGYESPYAVFVHENMEQKLEGEPRPSGLGVYWGPPQAGPKFLERAVEELEDEILRTVYNDARVK